MRLAKRMLLQRLQSKSDSNIKKACIQALSIIGDDPLFALYVGEPSRSFTSKKVKVARRFQPKDGTSTVLLGGKLFRRVILRGGRIINKGIQYGTGLSKEAVESWKRAYEFNWSTIGLDYNPIEPILKDKHGKYLIRQNSDGSFRVYAGVIPAFSQFAFSRKEGNLSLSKEAAPTARKIILTLRSIGVDHRHLHGNNLLLRFENGNPRVYVVDFDAAKLLNFLPPHN